MYTEMLSGLEGVVVTPDPPWGTGNSWLTTVSVRPRGSAVPPPRVRETLQSQNIEDAADLETHAPAAGVPVATRAHLNRWLTGSSRRLVSAEWGRARDGTSEQVSDGIRQATQVVSGFSNGVVSRRADDAPVFVRVRMCIEVGKSIATR